MNRIHALLVVVGLAASGAVAQPVSYTGGTYSQDFNTLPSVGIPVPVWTNSSTLPGWYAWRIADAQNATRADPSAVVTPISATTFFVTSGGTNSGGIYSYGNSADTNRALGSQGSGTPQDQSFCVVLKNDSSTTYNAVDISFIAEQWRNGGNATVQTVLFDYGIVDGTLDINTITPGNYVTGFTNFPALDLVSIVNTATAAALDGTLAANQTPKSTSITGVQWAPGQFLVVRWYDNNDTGTDHGMGIDNLSIAAREVLLPNVTTTIVDSPDPITLVGDNLTYTVTPVNGATTGTSSATLQFTLPANVQFISSSLGFSQNVATYTINIGALAANTTGTPFTIVLRPLVQFPASAPLVIPFTAFPGSNVTTVSTTVINAADLAVIVSSDAACVTSLAQPITYTVNLTNNGPAAATATVLTAELSPNVTYTSSTPPATVSGRTLTWNAGTLASGAAPAFTVNATISGGGGQLFRATAVTTAGDPVAANNTASLQTNTPSTLPALQAQLSSVANAATNSITLDFGGTPFVANFGTASAGINFNQFAFSRPFPSPDGSKFVLTGDTTFADTSNTFLIAYDGTTFRGIAQEGVTAIDSNNPSELVGIANPVFNRIQSINNAGVVAFSARTNGVGAPPVIVKATPGTPDVNGLVPYTFTTIARAGDNATVLGNTGAGNPIKYGNTISVAKGGMQADGSVAFSYLSDTGIRAAVKDNGATLLSRTSSALFSPNNQAGGTTANLSTFRDNTDTDANTRGFSITPDAQTWMLEATLATGAGITGTQDEVLILNNAAALRTIVLQEGYVAAGTGLTQTVGSYTHSEVEADGQWISFGAFNPVPPATRADDFIIRNAAVIAITGAPVTTGSAETWSDSVFASTFFLATGRGTDYVVGGLTSNPDATSDSIYVWNGTQILLREGQPINVGTSTEPVVYFAGPILRNHRGFIDGSRNFWAVVDLKNDQHACIATNNVVGQAIVRIALPAGAPVCVADVNLDGIIDGNDFTAFINSFGVGDAAVDPIADVNLDSIIDGNDFVAFINAFGAGC